jgi:two-component system response regulator MprA
MASRRTILVADDDQSLRILLVRILALDGYEVRATADGLEALEAVIAERPDALVLDVDMPRLTGIELCRRLRASGCPVPILIVSGNPENRTPAISAGANDFLSKPFALDELREHVGSVFGTHPQAA